MLDPWVYPVKRLVLSEKAGDWCRLPYPGHPKGCPNFNKNPRCPPKIGHVRRHFELCDELYLVLYEFDLAAHEERMRALHPDWSEKQLRCVLYWQPKSRKQLKERARLAMFKLDLNQVTYCPEGMGVNVYVTARLAGLKLEKIRELRICRHVALIGNRKERR